MRRFAFSLLLLLIAPSWFSPLFAGTWKKAYFGATPAGSWARYTDTSPQGNTTTTMTRLTDDDGSACVAVLMEFENNQYRPSTTVTR